MGALLVVGQRVRVRAGAFHRRSTPYGGYVGWFGGERVVSVSEVLEDERGPVVVYALRHHRPPFFAEEAERWTVPVEDVEPVEAGAEVRRRPSVLAS